MVLTIANQLVSFPNRMPQNRPNCWSQTTRQTATVLIVEPDTTARSVLRLTLEGGGYRVFDAASACTALPLALANAPDLILLNLDLPDLNGIDLVDYVRMLPGETLVRALAYSEEPARLQAARESGVEFAGLLLKPFLPSHLLRTVNYYLKSKAAPTERLVFRTEAGRTGARINLSSPTARRRILVVEDNPYQRRQLTAELRRLGYQVTLAAGGAEALRSAQECSPDGILSDVRMSGGDGLELCLAIRQDARLKNVPVVLAPLGHCEEIDRVVAENVGASAFVPRAIESFTGAVDALRTSLERPVEPLPARPRPVVEVMEVQVA